MQQIISKVRDIIEENLTSGKDIFTYESSEIFTISEPNVSEVTDVLVNDELLDSGEWSFDSDTNKLTIDSGVSLTEGDTIEIQFQYYPNYSDTEIKAFIRSALTNLSVKNYSTFFVDESENIQPEPTLKQENLIAMIAAILIRPDNRTYRLPDITIQAPVASLSKDEKINKTIAIFKKDGHGVFYLVGGIRP